jgi:hypothetical protein
MSKTLEANPKVQRAVRQLVEYLEQDEYLHFLGGFERNHIFQSVRIARDWLGMTPLHKDEAECIAAAMGDDGRIFTRRHPNE